MRVLLDERPCDTDPGSIGEAIADAAAVAEGFSATLKLLNQSFEKHGIAEVNPLGETFDPELHEAMATQPSADQAPDSVLMVVQKGYVLNERLLRPARVIVARAVEE